MLSHPTLDQLKNLKLHGMARALPGGEPHRVYRRLQLLRDWSYDKADLNEIFIGSARACRTNGA